MEKLLNKYDSLWHFYVTVSVEFWGYFKTATLNSVFVFIVCLPTYHSTSSLETQGLTPCRLTEGKQP